jgi:hypothetical protein
MQGYRAEDCSENKVLGPGSGQGCVLRWSRLRWGPGVCPHGIATRLFPLDNMEALFGQLSKSFLCYRRQWCEMTQQQGGQVSLQFRFVFKGIYTFKPGKLKIQRNTARAVQWAVGSWEKFHCTILSLTPASRGERPCGMAPSVGWALVSQGAVS